MNNLSSLKYIQKLTENIKPELAYTDAVSLDIWQNQAREKLRDLLGLPLPNCELEFEVLEEKECKTYKKVSFQFQSEPGYYVPCTLLIPNGIKKTKVVICLQGHSTGAHISIGVERFPTDKDLIASGRDFAVRVVEEGYCAIALEQRYMGVKGQDSQGNASCIVAHAAMAGLLIGRTPIGERVWDVMRLIDVIEAHLTEYIDSTQIICMGNSGGGTTAFYASCLEERISMSIPSCCVCSYEESIMAMNHCSCNYIPGIRNYFNMGDLGCLIAPRPLIVVCGTEDPIFPLSGVEKSFAIISRAYQKMEREEFCYLIKGKGGHQFYPDDVWPIVHQIEKRDDVYEKSNER